MANIPKDPVMLLSYMNTQLRDHYASLEDCCLALGINSDEVAHKLASIDYYYHDEQNQFQ